MVDDEQPNVDAVLRILRRAGFHQVEGTTDPRTVMERMALRPPDLLLLDLRMPHMDGFDILDRVRSTISPDQYFPVLVLTGDLSREVRERALSAGARDFLTKPFDITEVLLRIRNLLETRILYLQLRDYNQTLEERVAARTRELADAQIEILTRLARAAEYRDDITGHHADRVGALSALLAREMDRPPDEVRLLRWAATLHDVGKIGIPDAILQKPGPLTEAEYNLMKAHIRIGDRILGGSGFPLLRMAAEIALHHHEKWDGSGYQGLAGEEIPLVGRIVAVADVYDSLTHKRPYKGASSHREAVDEIGRCRGAHFDPAVVDAFDRLEAAGALREVGAMVEEGREPGADGLPLSSLSWPGPSDPRPTNGDAGSAPGP